jgi:hypothetical protein
MLHQYLSNNPTGIKLILPMKKNIFSTACATLLLSAGLISCKKENTNSTPEFDYETTFELSSNQAIADNLTEDANNIFMEAAANKNLLGYNGYQQMITSNTLNCATVTVTPATGFPKTIAINFGNGNCNVSNGIIRKGKINIILTDSVRKTGSKAVLTFLNYSINNFKKEGAITWTNTSQPSSRSWQRKVENGKITTPGEKYWKHSSIKYAVQVDGATTPNNLLDDVFLITGNQTVMNAAGKKRACYITEALQKKSSCDNIGSGKLKVQGTNHDAVINFGEGDCDKLATISIDGQAPRTITLR